MGESTIPFLTQSIQGSCIGHSLPEYLTSLLTHYVSMYPTEVSPPNPSNSQNHSVQYSIRPSWLPVSAPGLPLLSDLFSPRLTPSKPHSLPDSIHEFIPPLPNSVIFFPRLTPSETCPHSQVQTYSLINLLPPSFTYFQTLSFLNSLISSQTPSFTN